MIGQHVDSRVYMDLAVVLLVRQSCFASCGQLYQTTARNAQKLRSESHYDQEKCKSDQINSWKTTTKTYSCSGSSDFSGTCTTPKIAAPITSSFSAFRLPVFHRLASVHVKKCNQTSERERIGWSHTRLTNDCNCRRLRSINCSSYRPILSTQVQQIDFNQKFYK